MADTNTIGKVPESNVDSLYTEVDNTLSPIPEVPPTITETSIHNTTSVNLGADRENDNYLKINKEEKVSLQGLENKKTTYAPTANLDVTHFADKRFISKQLSDKNDTVIMADLDKEIARSYETDVVLANALNLEDEEREIADAQLRADIAKEALERANTDADLANALAKYKYAMSQHITTRELDVNGDARINIEVKDGDEHGGNLYVEKDIYTEDDFDTIKKYRDVIGTIKNALVKDFTQTYDPSTGKLTSKLEFQNYHTDNAERPTVQTIEKTIDLDLEKFIIDINDVYARVSVVNGKNVYTDVTDIESLSAEELEAFNKPDYTGNLRRCLKVKYSTHGNSSVTEDGTSKAGIEYSYVYFEVNDIFRSLLSNIQRNTKKVHLQDAAGQDMWVFDVYAPGTGNQDIYLKLDKPHTFNTTSII